MNYSHSNNNIKISQDSTQRLTRRESVVQVAGQSRRRADEIHIGHENSQVIIDSWIVIWRVFSSRISESDLSVDIQLHWTMQTFILYARYIRAVETKILQLKLRWSSGSFQELKIKCVTCAVKNLGRGPRSVRAQLMTVVIYHFITTIYSAVQVTKALR